MGGGNIQQTQQSNTKYSGLAQKMQAQSLINVNMVDA